jgi:hypothetical protein
MRALSLAAAVVVASVAVPDRVQRAIVRSHPLVAYFPTRLPAGYRYAKYVSGDRGFDIWFNNPVRSPNDLGYDVLVAACSTAGRPMHTFSLNGVRVFWSATYEDQHAWRCLTRGGMAVILTASRSVPGDDNLSTPRQRRDALDLVRLIALSERLR